MTSAEIREVLRHGDQVEIARQFECTRANVSRLLEDKRESERTKKNPIWQACEKAALEILLERGAKK